MSGRKRGRPFSKPVKVAPLTIEQKDAADPPQSFERPEDAEALGMASKPLIDEMDKEMPVVEKLAEANTSEPFGTIIEVPVELVPITHENRLKAKIVSLSKDIDEFEPHSKRWCEMLEEIGDLKRKLDKL